MSVIKLEELMPDVARKAAEGRADERSARAQAAKLRGAIDEVIRWVPPAYAGAELDAAWLLKLVGHDVITRARESIGERAGACIGAPGSGKSSLAAAVYKAAARSETDPAKLSRFRWVSSHKLAKARAGQPLGEGEAPLVDACLVAPMLVLDELGGEDPRYASAVAEVLYERYEQQLPTWVTTGVGAKEIATRYGGGISRRVFEYAAIFRLGAKP